MRTVKEQAEFFRLALAMSLASAEEVIEWADQLVLSSNDSPETIEISLAVNHPPVELIDLLKAVPGNCDYLKIVLDVMLVLQKRLIENQLPDSFIKMMRSFFNEVTLPQKFDLPASEQDLYLLEEGYGSEEVVLQRIINYLNEQTVITVAS